MAQIVDVVLLAFLCAIALVVVRMRDLFGIAMLFGIFSLVTASVFVSLDAADVAMTEAAVGAGVSTILMLSTLAATGTEIRPRPRRWRLPLVVVLLTGAGLVYATLDMPRYGSADSPIQTHPIAERYIDVAPTETGIPNMVTALLANYRGFDTLGETAVVFTAGIGVLALIGRRRSRGGAPEEAPRGDDLAMGMHPVVRIAGKLLLAPILLYACYIQAHGEISAGGGFQAGVVFASGLMLYMLLFGIDAAERVAPPQVLEKLLALGLLLYGAVGVAGLLLGGNYLDYRVLGSDGPSGIHLGVVLVELGVGITVASVVTTIVFAFTGRLRRGAVAPEV